MLVYTSLITGRIDYTFTFICKEWLGLDYRITNDLEEAARDSGPVINYSEEKIEGAFNVIPVGLLTEDYIEHRMIDVEEWNGMPVWYITGGDIPFDLPSAVFFLLSRYEEYNQFEYDKHGRYDPEASMARKHDFLGTAVIDRWMMAFSSLLSDKHPGLNPVQRKFRFVPTIDIDVPWAYLHKDFNRSAGGYLRDLIMGNWGEARKRIRVLNGKISDPYDTYDYIDQVITRYGSESIYFFHVGEYGRYDKGPGPENRQYQLLIQSIAGDKDIGLHPSYLSNEEPGIMLTEKQMLERIVNGPVIRSRQHYLKFRIPYTYQWLIEMGIVEEYSMGYASQPGFRAGTATPFYFYDLEKETTTGLKIYPFAVMDGTLNDYMDANPGQALTIIQQLMDEVKFTGGWFISIWHNQSLCDANHWKGWKGVFESMFEYAISKQT